MVLHRDVHRPEDPVGGIGWPRHEEKIATRHCQTSREVGKRLRGLTGPRLTPSSTTVSYWYIQPLSDPTPACKTS